MIGCCGAGQQKFKTSEGEIDMERLAKLMEKMREAGCNERQLERAKTCDCLCHRDGIQCLC